MLVAAFAALGGLSVAAADAGAARPLTTGFAELRFTSRDDSTRELWFDRTEGTGAQIVRLTATWRGIVTSQPAVATDPADPGYDFSRLDAAVRSAKARGFEPLITTYFAPEYATEPGRPGSVPRGAWKPVPAEYGKFAKALATRYSGAFDPDGPPGEPALPRVRYYQGWNEPNLKLFLAPQWNGKRPVAPARYRALLNAFYGGVRSVDPSNQVVTAGTSPFGEKRGGDRFRPVAFWRSVFCLKEKKRRNGKRRLKKACDSFARFDVHAHHPLSALQGGPFASARHRDDATASDLNRVRRVLRKAEKTGGARPGRHPLWVTELWWQSKPLKRGVRLRKHARWLSRGFYEVWKDGARAVIWLGVGDDRAFKTGVYRAGGRPKPALRAFRFPFTGVRKGKRYLAWGKSPAAGRVKIQAKRKRGTRWRTIARKRVGTGQVFKRKIRAPRGTWVRAKVGREKSLAVRLGKR